MASTSQENQAETSSENAPPESKRDLTLEHLFDLLGSLRQVLARSTNICVEEKEYGVNGYGPKPWIPTICESVPTRFDVLLIGRDRIPYIIRKPIYTSKVHDIDSLITETHSAFNKVIDMAMIFIREPPTFRMLEQQRCEPESLGFPYSSLLDSGIDPAIVNSAVHRFLNPTRRHDNHNYSEGFIFNGTPMDEAMREFFEISQHEMRVLSLSIEAEELRTRRGIPDNVKMPIFGNNMLFEVVMNPFIITNIFEHLPRRMHFSAGLILELQKPDVMLGPVDIGTLQKTASLSVTRATPIASMFSIDYTPDMSEAINAYLITCIIPGLIQFDVHMDDISPADYPLKALCACLCKLLFAYSEVHRWNNITLRGARVVEQAIVEAGVHAHILEIAPGPAGLPLGRVNATQQANIHDLNGIVSTGNGGGWREGDNQRYAPMDPAVPYAGCCNRQRFVHDIEDVNELDHPDRILHYNQWRVSRTANSFLASANRHGEDKSSYAGASQVFKLLSSRIFDFFAVVNEYNAYNWHSSLRLSDASMNELYTDNSEEPAIVPINGKTILYLAKSLCSTTVLQRRVPYLAQVKAECAIARDCAESAIKAHIFDSINREHGIPENSFRGPERIEFIAPNEGPLSDHIKLLRSAGLSSSIGPFYETVMHNPLVEMSIELANVVIQNPLDYGLLPSVELGTQIADRSVQALQRFSQNNIPYTNIGIFEDNEHDPGMNALPRERVAFQQMSALLGTYNLQHTIRNLSARGIVSLSIPIPYAINTSSIIAEYSGDLLQVKYDTKRPDNNLRKCISWNACNINVTDISHDELQRPDLYVLNFSTINRVSIPSAVGRRIFVSATEWLANIDSEATRCVYIRTDNIKLTSIFTRS
uniref:VP3 n=1 Tax=Morris orbivirus TaxID=1963252 RepID=A0A1S6PCZ5_9REOV|nr:VP3 [Morris orbivirus]